MQLRLIIGPIVVFDLLLFETIDPVEIEQRPEDDGPDDLDKRLRGED
jgi:hypothetical protein